ncbi:hypothetical protein MJ561_17825 [Klebsiella pneumoniae]|nr:hypothetical protein MJ561_17825 [Klebsiella pneumoniae]
MALETVTAQELLSPMADKSRYSGHLIDDFNVRAERMGRRRSSVNAAYR